MVNGDVTHVWELRLQSIKIQLTGEDEEERQKSLRVRVFSLETEKDSSSQCYAQADEHKQFQNHFKETDLFWVSE